MTDVVVLMAALGKMDRKVSPVKKAREAEKVNPVKLDRKVASVNGVTTAA